MSNRVVHFEIHTKDRAKMQKFYSDVFGWTYNDMGGPEYGNYSVVLTGPAMPELGNWGINGGMTERKGDLPKDGQAVNAYVCIIGVDNIDDSFKKATEAGGTVALPIQDVPKVGKLAYIKDPEGNIFGMIQPDLESMPQPGVIK